MIVTIDKFPSLILYLTIYILSALFLHIANISTKRSNRVFFVFFAVLFPCVLAGIRYGVGVDYYNYNYMYQNHAELTFAEYIQYDQRIELGTYILIKIASIFNSSQMFFILFALIIYVPVVKMIMERENKEDTFFLTWFFLLSHFSTGMNIMRQVAAASILLYSLKYVLDRKFKKFILMVALASLFHVSAIIMLPIYFIWKRENKFNMYQFKSWAVIVAYCIVAICLPVILQLLGGRFADYSTGEIQGRNLSILLSCMWLAIFLFFNKQITYCDDRYGLYIFMVIIGTILSFTGVINVYLKRTAIYFNYVDFILLVQLKNAYDFKSQRFFYIFATVYSVGMFILTYYILGQT